MDREFDAIIVGAGHNGLTTAGYLGAAGLKTLVLERRATVGGCCVTEEVDAKLAPGCRVSTCSYIASMLRPEVARDLHLVRHGLRMVTCEPGVMAVFNDADRAAWWGDRARLNRELARIAPGEAEQFHRVFARLKRLARCLQPFFLQPPPDTHATGWQGFRERLRLWIRLRSLHGDEITDLVSLLSGSLGDFLERNFHSEKLKRLILANSLYGKHGGPYQPGTALGLLFHLLSGGEGAEQGWAGHVIGGMGAITRAMAASCRERGVEIRLQTPVAAIRVDGGRSTGVQLEDGEELTARVVVSNADPKHTFLHLLPGDAVEESFRRRIAAIKMDGPCAKVNFVLATKPRVTALARGLAPTEQALFTLVPTLEQAEHGYQAASRGEIAEPLWVDCVVPTLVDPELTRPGTHILTCFVQYVPYRLRQGSWDLHRDRLGDQVLARIAEFAPNVPAAVVARQVLTPLDLETEFGITEGNIFHGDPGLEQLFFMRPLPGWSQYVTPVTGLYLCGAGTHPGGGVTGAPGYNAAQRILRDLRRRVHKH